MNTAIYYVKNTLGFKADEPFTVMEAINKHADSTGTSASAIAGFGIFFSLGVLLLGFLTSYGAARLSYNYNIYTHNQGAALAWSVLCFFFPALYYPFYAIFLDPLGSMVAQTIMIGGKMRRK